MEKVITGNRPVTNWEAKDTLPVVAYCVHFGCGKELSLVQQLCGNRCEDHQGKQRDITYIVSGQF